MRAFEYARPTTKEQAVALLSDSWDAASVLAGGTDLLALMKDEVVAPKRLVDIKDIADMKGVAFTAGAGLRIGALATLDDLLAEPAVKKSYAALAEAAEGVLSPQLRSRGTVGGDLCQRPRCWYYRSGFGLLATGPDGKPLVPGGDNRYHAVLGAGPSYFVCPSSLAPALIAFGAQVRILGPKGPRDVPVAKFFRAPATAAEREHDLKPNEIVTEIRVPLSAGFVSATYEVRQRETLDWPLATASVALRLAGGSVQTARIVLGHVAPVPWASAEAEKALTSKGVSEQSAQAAADAAVASAKALSRNAYKIVLARTAVKRAILAAAGGVR